jgi:tetratricopeptide (TPR) repeat protein
VGRRVPRGAGALTTVRIDEIPPIRVVDGKLEWRPVRRTLGVQAFGINAYTADAGDLVVEQHDETGHGAGHHEELYVVVSGHATFTVDGTKVDAPPGTLVFLDDPKETRGAVATENGTTVLAIGGARGQAYQVSPWEYYFAAVPAWERQDWDEAERLLREGLAAHPGNPSILYNLAAVLAQRGERDEALELLRQSLTAEPEYRSDAESDDDLEPLRSDPRFSEVLGQGTA